MASQAALDGVQAHWCTLIENMQASSQEFYRSLEAQLRQRQIPDTKNERVDYKESGVISARREYLRVEREKLTFDVCAAPFGTGFFVSWWLAEEKPSLNALVKIVMVLVMLGLAFWTLDQAGFFWGAITICAVVAFGLLIVNGMAKGGDLNDDIVRVLPILGPLYVWLFKAVTYYRIDTMLMFREAVHQAVMAVVDDMTKTKGLRMLSEAERKPIMREFYQRKAA